MKATSKLSAKRRTPRASSLVKKLRSHLQGMILSGKIHPGERLNELMLASRFGVSRGPIREAIRALEQARLVTTIPNRGSTVSRLDLQDALELYDVRAGLARSAGRLLAMRATTAQIGVLQKLHEQMCEAATAGSANMFHTANLRFHDAILAFAGNRRLREIDQSIQNELQLYIRRGSLGDAQMRMSNAEHAAFLQALAAGEAYDAAQALEQHVLNGRQRMLENLPRVQLG